MIARYIPKPAPHPNPALTLALSRRERGFIGMGEGVFESAISPIPTSPTSNL